MDLKWWLIRGEVNKRKGLRSDFTTISFAFYQNFCTFAPILI